MPTYIRSYIYVNMFQGVICSCQKQPSSCDVLYDQYKVLYSLACYYCSGEL